MHKILFSIYLYVFGSKCARFHFFLIQSFDFKNDEKKRKTELPFLKKIGFLNQKKKKSFLVRHFVNEGKSFLIFDDRKRPFLDKIHILVGTPLIRKTLDKKLFRLFLSIIKKHLRQHS